jgi:hypothetical protein
MVSGLARAARFQVIVCPNIVAVGMITSVARRTSSLTSSGAIPEAVFSCAADTGTPPADPPARVSVGASVGANDPADGTGAGGLAD